VLYTTLKFVHILLAIIAVGFNASYGIWLARAARQPEHLGHILRGIKILDDRAANPAYGLLLLTGLAMVAVAGYPPSTFWIAAALVLWLIAIVIGFAGYTPALRRQIELLERVGPTASASPCNRGAQAFWPSCHSAATRPRSTSAAAADA
jgi:uncharacterized membrane protein